MSTLIFGGTGFVGLNLVEHLLTKGEQVTIFDKGSMPDDAIEEFNKLPGSFELFEGDVRDLDSIAQAMRQSPKSLIYGAAITSGIERDISDPKSTIEVNLMGFLNVLECARGLDSCRIINLSSSGAYGDAAFGNNVLFEANTDPDPKTIYAVSKFASERIGTRMGELWKLDVVSVRLSAVFGRWERQTNVRDTPSPLYQIASLILKGENVKLSREDCRDWIYAPDIARAVRAVRDAHQLRHSVYNISNGQYWSALKWGQAFAKHFSGIKCDLSVGQEKPNVETHTPKERKPLSIERLQQDTSFVPKYDLDSSVADYYSWLTKPKSQHN